MLNKKSYILSIVTLLISIHIEQTISEIFSSMDQMMRLPDVESKIGGHLRSFLDNWIEKLKQAEEIVKRFESIANHSNRNPKEFMGNPVNSFLMIKTLTHDLNSFVDLFNNNQDIFDVTKEVKQNLVPNEEDYVGAGLALQRIEDTYLLKPSDIIKGKFGQSHPVRHLNALECFELGTLAQEKEDHQQAIKWLYEALKQVENEGLYQTVNRIHILNHLTYSRFKLGNVVDAIEETKTLLKIDPTNEKLKQNLQVYKRKLAQDIVDNLDKNEVSKPDNLTNLLQEYHVYEREMYKSLCRCDESNIDRKIKSKLSCQYASYHSMLKIGPIKQEQISRDPPIWIFYDVVTQRQVDQMIETARARLQRAMVGVSPLVHNIRVSKMGWLYDNEMSFLPYLTKLVSALTNLSMDVSEGWQINNYGLGGHYEVHVDHMTKQQIDESIVDQIMGNRIATWMFYLEAPELGGATVFPEIDVQVRPVSRSAVFWYNLLPSGVGDARTKHAACPVVVGSKWVVNKWIRESGETFRRPCRLEQDTIGDLKSFEKISHLINEKSF